MDRLKCDFCGGVFSAHLFSVHLRKKHADRFNSEYDITKFYFSVNENMGYDKIDSIIMDYSDKSVSYINEKYGIRFRKYLDGLGLKSKTVSESRNTKECREKSILTTRKKYGVDNVSQSDDIKEKKRNTSLKNYGVDNIWKWSGYRKNWEELMISKYGRVCLADLYGNQNQWGWKEISDGDKKIRTDKMINGYSTWYTELSDSDRDIYNAKKSKGIVNASKSKLEIRVENILNKNLIYNKSQYWIKNRSFDFYIGNNVLIEINGKYWHCDPRFYLPDDIVNFGGEYIKVSAIWERDLIKAKLANDNGYIVHCMWETDILKMTDLEIFNFIKSIIDENKKNKKNNDGPEKI